MTFILPKYRGYAAATIKNRADIPDQADMVVNGDNVEYNLVNMTKIRNALGASTLKQTELHNHANVNVWSGFGPVTRSVSGGVLVNSIPAPYGKNEFAGYNHGAVTPGWDGMKPYAEATKSVESGQTVTLEAEITIGEVQYPHPIVGVALTLWEGSVLHAFRIIPLSGLEDYARFTIANGTGVTVGPISGTTTFTGKIYLVNDLTSFTDDLLYVVCGVPNVTDYSVTVKLKIATTFTYFYNHDPAGTDFVVNAGINPIGVSTGDGGRVGWNEAYFSNDYTNVAVYANLYERDYTNDTWVQRGSTVAVWNSGGYYFGLTPIGAVLSSEIWPGNTVRTHDFLYEIIIDADV